MWSKLDDCPVEDSYQKIISKLILTFLCDWYPVRTVFLVELV
jgi:hypothetical protein